MNESSYGGSDAMSWLLSLGQSLLLSLVLWQPLTLYVVTWIKIWMFTWNLPIRFPVSCPKLMRRCCCGLTTAEQLAFNNSLSGKSSEGTLTRSANLNFDR